MGSRNVVEQVLAVGRDPEVNSTLGTESKPRGGGTLAPVTNIMTSSKVAAASEPKKQKGIRKRNVKGINEITRSDRK